VECSARVTASASDQFCSLAPFFPSAALLAAAFPSAVLASAVVAAAAF